MLVICIIIICVVVWHWPKKIPRAALHVPDIAITKTLQLQPQKKTQVIDTSDIVHYKAKQARKAAKVAKSRAIIKLRKNATLQRSYTIREDLNNYALEHDPEPVLDFTADAQNVHDSVVQNTIRNKYAAINTNANKSNTILNYDEILCVSGTKAAQVRVVLQQIQSRNAQITNLQTSEVCVLNNAWSAASATVKQQIINELLDTRDGDTLVCPTGVVSRIINANVVEQPESSPRTTAALRTEMLTTAAAVRDALETDIIYMANTTEQQNIILKAALEKKYNKDYTGIISQDKIQDELNTWLAHI